LTRDTGILFP